MPSRRITPLLVFLPFLLAACAGNNKKQAHPPGISQADFAKISDYGERVRTAIAEAMFDIDSYRGQKCTVRVSILPDGMLMNATAEKGDPELCQAALSAVARAKIPPAPDEKTGQQFKKAYLDFTL